MFAWMKLRPFIKANPPYAGNAPAPKGLVESFRGQVPDFLLELWRRYGLGFYGRRQLLLVDPRSWQATLDRWIISPPDSVTRVPIALTPFGSIVLYRRLTETDEDIAVLDPGTRSMEVLTWDLVEFFNAFMCDPERADTLIPSKALDAARRELGALEPGEIYEADPVLLPAQLLRHRRIDALQLHKRLRDQVDAPQESDIETQSTIAAILPPEFHGAFAEAAAQDRPERAAAGLYLSSHLDRHRLLALMAGGTYRLLFWTTDEDAAYPSRPRLYSGAYETTQAENGDSVIHLKMEEMEESSGSDYNDEKLLVVQSGDARYLLQITALKDIAVTIGWNGRLDDPDQFFVQVDLSDMVPPYAGDGWPAPPWSDLPAALQQLIHREPLQARITQVEPLDEDDDSTMMVTVDLGTDDGLSMNMPFCSPAGAEKSLHGWVWRLDAKACGIGIDVTRDDRDEIIEVPEIGDILTSRKPSAGKQG